MTPHAAQKVFDDRLEVVREAVALRWQCAVLPPAVRPPGRAPGRSPADTLGFHVLTEAKIRRRPCTTNALEREHEELRCRTRVIRIFPKEASYRRLATALAADRNDVWAKRRCIIPTSPTINVRNVRNFRNVRRRREGAKG